MANHRVFFRVASALIGSACAMVSCLALANDHSQAAPVSPEDWVGRNPSERIGGKTFYDVIGFNERALTAALARNGMRAATIRASVVIRRESTGMGNTRGVSYYVAYCSAGKPHCAVPIQKAEALLAAENDYWPSGRTNAVYTLWMMNQRRAANAKPAWCVTRGPNPQFPISTSRVECVEGVYQYGWAANAPIPYRESQVVLNNDFTDWIVGGYRELSGGNEVAKALIGGFVGALSESGSGPKRDPYDTRDVTEYRNKGCGGTCIPQGQ